MSQMLMLALLLGVQSGAVPSKPSSDAALSVVDETLRLHTQGSQRSTDFIALGTIKRAELVLGALPGTQLLEAVGGTISAAQIPYYLVAGENVVDSVKRTLEERMANDLSALLHRTLSTQTNLTQLGEDTTTQELERRFHISTELLDAAAKREGLVETERAVLRDAWNRMLQANLNVTMQQVLRNKSTLRDVTKSQQALGKQVTTLNRNLEQVANAVQRLSDAAAAAEEVDAQWMKKSWREGKFEERLAIAKHCKNNQKDRGCSDLSNAERDQLLVRGQVRNAAMQVSQATDVYVRGSLQIADNLGVKIPSWVAKTVTGLSSGASLVAGISSGQPEAIINGLVGLTSLFRKARPSPEQRIFAKLERIDQRLAEMNQRLDIIDQKLDQLLHNQAAMQASLNRIEEELGDVKTMLEATMAIADHVNQEGVKACAAMSVPRHDIGVWSVFFKDRLYSPNDEGAVDLDSNEDFKRACANFLMTNFQSRKEDSTTFFWLMAAASGTGNADAIIDEEKTTRAIVGRYESMLGGQSLGLLQPILLMESASRTDLTLRFARRANIDWDVAKGDQEVRSTVRRLSFDRLLPVVARTAVIFREKPKIKVRQEALQTIEKLLGRAILQRMLFDTDVALALMAARHVEGGISPTVFATLLDKFLTEQLTDGKTARSSRRATHFVGDVLDAALWRATGTVEAFERQRMALQLAWTSRAVDTMNVVLGRSFADRNAPLAPASEFLEARAESEPGGPVKVCLRSERTRVEFAPLDGVLCLSQADYQQRAQLDEPSNVRGARFWLRALAAERSRPIQISSQQD